VNLSSRAGPVSGGASAQLRTCTSTSGTRSTSARWPPNC